MQLRPHHFLCIPMFTGKGYDEMFTLHMTRIKKMLFDDMEIKIIIQKGCDELCKRCPNRKHGFCTEYEKVRRLDEKVMAACGCSYGDEVVWMDIICSVRKKIFDAGLFEHICCECEWYSICTEIKEAVWKK